jgi:dihydroorotase
MSGTLIKNATIVNEGMSFKGDLLIIDEIISAVGSPGKLTSPRGAREIDASGLFLIPGVIDDHVHFREPGLTHKGDIFSESRAAVAGGITSFMDMPNTVPPTTTIEALVNKFSTGSEKSLANYSFYIGATGDNLDEIININPGEVCGIKLFMGSSTGGMLVHDNHSLDELFKRAPVLIAAHCEDETLIKTCTSRYMKKHGDDIPVSMHPLIRNRDACFLSSSRAIDLARKYNSRLHVLHLSTADEMKLFTGEVPLVNKRITAEACIHHLWFDDSDYDLRGSRIKCNPAIKTRFDRDSLIDGLNSNRIDVVATDHAPHSALEKTYPYTRCPSGGPMVQHSLVAMLEFWHGNILSIEKIVEKMCHNPAIIFNIRERGFIREGYKADLCLIDPAKPLVVGPGNILYKCGWSAFEGTTFRSGVRMTIVNGTIVYDNGVVDENFRGQRLCFDR